MAKSLFMRVIHNIPGKSFLWQLFFLSCFYMQAAANPGPVDNPDAGRLHRALQAGPAAGVNITWTSCVAGTTLNISSSGSASYTFGPSDCDGNGFTAIAEATGVNPNSQARVVIGSTSGNNVLRFDRNLTSGTPAVFIASHLKSTAGDLFKLTNLTVFPPNNNNQTLTVTAYKAGVAVSGSTITINYVSSTPLHGTTLTSTDFGINYDNIDEIRATSSTNIGILLDNIQTATALPVTFLYFNGQADGSNVLLNWGTATESNVKNFEIERSADGTIFLSRGMIGSKAIGGRSSSPLNYSYTDIIDATSPFSLFYRLKESDLDGRPTYSPILKIDRTSGSSGLSVYPNPFSQQVTVTIASPVTDKAAITVTDISGRHVLEQVSPLQKGSNILPLSALSQLGKGIYLLTIVTGQQKQTVELMKVE
jgi:hypothetical protein